MENRRENIERMAVRLNELESEIGELEKLAEKAVTELKDEYSQQIKELFLKKEELQNKVDKIKESTGNAWEDMKAGAELSWEVFQDSVKSRKKNPK
jgi:archaellum component FlaC